MQWERHSSCSSCPNFHNLKKNAPNFPISKNAPISPQFFLSCPKRIPTFSISFESGEKSAVAPIYQSLNITNPRPPTRLSSTMFTSFWELCTVHIALNAGFSQILCLSFNRFLNCRFLKCWQFLINL